MELEAVKNLIKNASLVPHKRRRARREIIDLVCAFDIETTTIMYKDEYHAFMYVWQFSANNEVIIIGRTWEEYQELVSVIEESLKELKEEYNLKESPLLCVYVHNLAFEFQFLSGIFDFMPEDVFLRGARKPIYARTGCIEYRCSYIQSNMSLARFCQAMGVKEQKKSGQKYDYTKTRYPWTELPNDEIEYCRMDVISVVACIKKELEKENDTLLSIPLTSTGYVRRECYNALKPKMKTLQSIMPTLEEYTLLRKAFRGGNTHANKYYVGKVVDNVLSDDKASSYSAQLVNEKYPYKFKKIDSTVEEVHRFISYGCAVVFTVIFKNLELRREKEACPYISLAKTRSAGGQSCGDGYLDMILDNGRILSAGISEMTITEIDYDIIRNQYKWEDMTVTEAMFAEKDYLPKEFIDVILEYFSRKTKLKGLEDEENQYFYMKAKNLLNSLYGMCATNPIQDTIEYIDNDYIERPHTDEENKNLLMKAKLPYQWGVYCTAYARKALQDGIDAVADALVYCDTDSVKYVGDANFDKVNKSIMIQDKKRGGYAVDGKGTTHYLGIFEPDGKYEKFITQGAKRYAYITNGKLKVTVSGVTKKINEQTGKPFASEELKDIENFKVGMIWKDAGGTRAIYNDNDNFDIDVEGKTLHISKNVVIVPTTYELTYSKDYDELLNRISLYGRWRKDKRV